MRLLPGRSLAVKLALALLLACFAVYALVLLDVHRWTRAMLLEQIQREGEAVIAGAAARIDGELSRVEEASRRLAHALGERRQGRAELEGKLCGNVAASPTVFGSAAAFEPFAFASGLRALSPYCYREGLRGDEGRLVGIATADVALAWLERLMSGIRVGRTGYALREPPRGG